MTDIEIPYKADRSRGYRFFEMLPGALSWSLLALPFLLSIINVTLAAVFVFVYLLISFARAMSAATRSLHGFRVLQQHKAYDWRQLLDELEGGAVDPHVRRPEWHHEQIAKQATIPRQMQPSEILHAVFVATYNESRDVLEPTIKSLINANYDSKKIIFVLAYEQRGGERVAKQAQELVARYKGKFFDAMAIEHPHDLPGEVIGKGGNITYAGYRFKEYLEQKHINPSRVVVTTLDADNRPDKEYFGALTYAYVSCEDPVRASFQPVSIYNNNIWDAPAPMRVLATGNSFFHIVQSLRIHSLRNFSAHAQGMASLIKTDFWSVRTIVEDGHQFWRSYFRFDGDYRVYPLHVPIYQDAVLASTYRKTLKAQFIQLRRWTWGASDIAYVVNQGYFKKNKVPRLDLLAKTLRLTEGHITWAVGPLLVTLGGFIPALFHPLSYTANEVPLLVSRIQTFALLFILATLFICFKTLPPKPERYKRHRTVFMVLQWAYLPLTTIVYNSFAALYSQTRLLLGRYIDKFDVTEKAVVNSEGKARS